MLTETGGAVITSRTSNPRKKQPPGMLMYANILLFHDHYPIGDHLLHLIQYPVEFGSGRMISIFRGMLGERSSTRCEATSPFSNSGHRPGDNTTRSALLSSGHRPHYCVVERCPLPWGCSLVKLDDLVSDPRHGVLHMPVLLCGRRCNPGAGRGWLTGPSRRPPYPAPPTTLPIRLPTATNQLPSCRRVMSTANVEKVVNPPKNPVSKRMRTIGVRAARSSAIPKHGDLRHPQIAEERAALTPMVRILLLTGFFGGFTTFSTFAVETVTLLQDGSWLVAVGSLMGNILVGGACAMAGI